MVFQNYALYPHMSVRENMAFGLKLRKFPKAEIGKRVDEAARMLDLVPLLERKPKALSGGQRQRVAMGRAIVRNPKVFLFDEPLSNLDAKLRVQMRTEIKKVHQLVPTTTVYVTHDQVEAMTLADRVVVMNGGIIEQVGPPQELYHHPATKFVAGFIGSPGMNFMPARLVGDDSALSVQLEDGQTLPVPEARRARYAPHHNKEMLLGLRPEHLTDMLDPGRPGIAPFRAKVDVVEPMGMETLVHFFQGKAAAIARGQPGQHGQARGYAAAAGGYGQHAPDRYRVGKGGLRREDVRGSGSDLRRKRLRSSHPGGSFGLDHRCGYRDRAGVGAGICRSRVPAGADGAVARDAGGDAGDGRGGGR